MSVGVDRCRQNCELSINDSDERSFLGKTICLANCNVQFGSPTESKYIVPYVSSMIGFTFAAIATGQYRWQVAYRWFFLIIAFSVLFLTKDWEFSYAALGQNLGGSRFNFSQMFSNMNTKTGGFDDL